MVEITQQERNLLNLIASRESGRHGYTAYYPGSNEPTITQMTITQIHEFQDQMLANQRMSRPGSTPSSAIGRYQFISGTLREAYGFLGLDPSRTRFTSDVQDALILAVLKRSRGMNTWLSGSSPSNRTTDPDQGFQVRLAMEFASVPVPFTMPGANRTVYAGESYYAGDGINVAHHNAESFTSGLRDIRNGGTGEISQLDVASTTVNGAVPAQGASPRRVAENAVSGGQRMIGGHPTSRIPASSANLPIATDVYYYEIIDPYDNRYDFRTGKKVRDMGINGTTSAAQSGATTPNYGAGSGGSAGTPGVAPQSTNPRGADDYNGENGRLDPSTLTPVGNGHRLRADAAAAYLRMVDAARADGISWSITDSYRTYEAQVDVARRKGLYSQGGLAATPGTSNHGWGTALDLGGGANNNGTPQNNWLRANAGRFGFRTIAREPWHWQYG